MFARPKNISEAYGGGRALTPADSAMTKEECAEYNKRMRKKMDSYRAKQGLLVDPVKARECAELTKKGVLHSLQLRNALPKSVKRACEPSLRSQSSSFRQYQVDV